MRRIFRPLYGYQLRRYTKYKNRRKKVLPYREKTHSSAFQNNQIFSLNEEKSLSDEVMPLRFGTSVAVTASFGMIAASVILRRLAKGEEKNEKGF